MDESEGISYPHAETIYRRLFPSRLFDGTNRGQRFHTNLDITGVDISGGMHTIAVFGYCLTESGFEFIHFWVNDSDQVRRILAAATKDFFGPSPSFAADREDALRRMRRAYPAETRIIGIKLSSLNHDSSPCVIVATHDDLTESEWQWWLDQAIQRMERVLKES